jgi:hypothetical protein
MSSLVNSLFFFFFYIEQSSNIVIPCLKIALFSSKSMKEKVFLFFYQNPIGLKKEFEVITWFC